MDGDILVEASYRLWVSRLYQSRVDESGTNTPDAAPPFTLRAVLEAFQQRTIAPVREHDTGCTAHNTSENGRFII